MRLFQFQLSRSKSAAVFYCSSHCSIPSNVSWSSGSTAGVELSMEGDSLSGLGNGGGDQVDGKVLQTFQKSFVQVQSILDQNRLLINEINQNHESRIPGNLGRNVGLIRELNSNIRRVVDLYAGLSVAFAEATSEDDSAVGGRAGHKRHRPL